MATGESIRSGLVLWLTACAPNAVGGGQWIYVEEYSWLAFMRLLQNGRLRRWENNRNWPPTPPLNHNSLNALSEKKVLMLTKGGGGGGGGGGFGGK